jgi:hypothetical protein
MFQLNEEIRKWRRQMVSSGIKTPELLDELENHLREEIRQLLSADLPEAEAFQLAVTRIGSSELLRTEFNKLKPASCRAVTIGSWSWAVVVTLLVVFLVKRSLDGKLGLLLLAHVFTISAGYGAGFLAGAFGIYSTFRNSFDALSPVRRQSLGHAVLRFSQLAAALALTGFVLGMIWSRQHLGPYLGSNPREIGGLCATLWLLASSVIQQFGRLGGRAQMRMAIGGNIVVLLAWFGAGLISDSHGAHPLATGGLWPVILAALLGLHLLFLVPGGMAGRKQSV